MDASVGCDKATKKWTRVVRERANALFASVWSTTKTISTFRTKGRIDAVCRI